MQLIKDRTSGIRAFRVISLDFEGPIMYKTGGSEEKKIIYIAVSKQSKQSNASGISAKSNNQGIYKHCKRVIARREVPRKIIQTMRKHLLHRANG